MPDPHGAPSAEPSSSPRSASAPPFGGAWTVPGGDDPGLRFGWFVPTSGDTAHLGRSAVEIPPSLDHFLDVALAAERAGFEYLLVPVQTACWEAYVTCSFLAARTERIAPLLAARAGFVAPTVMAKMLTTFDQLSQGRLKVNLITGGSAAEMAADGLFADHDERYDLLDETVELMKQVWTADGRVDFAGRHHRVDGALVLPRPYQRPHPPIYLGGASEAAKDVSVRHADVHLFWGDTPARIAAEVADLHRRAALSGRTAPLRAGMRLQVIVREREADAWDAAHELVAGASDHRRDKVRALWDQSTANMRQQELADAEDLHVGGHPHLWAGIARLRPGAGVAVVGDPDQVAATLDEFVEAGCRDFCLSGYPHDVEATRFGSLVMERFAGRIATPVVDLVRAAAASG
ncbi:MAG: LLM class flavin-dependent oxidoreductase [Actinomycetota bacterium]|nr:LLM class flavin-dependent oxidoreductase [Actinomycetota bacterium]